MKTLDAKGQQIVYTYDTLNRRLTLTQYYPTGNSESRGWLPARGVDWYDTNLGLAELLAEQLPGG